MHFALPFSKYLYTWYNYSGVGSSIHRLSSSKHGQSRQLRQLKLNMLSRGKLALAQHTIGVASPCRKYVEYVHSTIT